MCSAAIRGAARPEIICPMPTTEQCQSRLPLRLQPLSKQSLADDYRGLQDFRHSQQNPPTPIDPSLYQRQLTTYVDHLLNGAILAQRKVQVLALRFAAEYRHYHPSHEVSHLPV